MNKKRLIIICGIVVAVLLIIGIIIFFIWNKKDNVPDVIVKENVVIITDETDAQYQPIEVSVDAVVFQTDMQYEIGDVIVAGITAETPNGFIRKITGVKTENDKYIYETEHAVLTDVFEKAHIVKTFAITENEVKDLDEIDNGIMTLDLSAATLDMTTQSLAYTENNLRIQKTAATNIKPSENGLGIVVELDEKTSEGLQIKGEAEINTYFEVKLDIDRGNVEFGMAVHTDTNGELFIGCQEDWTGTYEKEILSTVLPSIEFLVGHVPIVITNDFELSAEVSAEVKGQIGTTIGIGAERVLGFEYNSKTGRITEINEKKYLSDGMEWKTEAKASGELEAGIYAHLITKLYGSTGVDLAVGIAGEVEGEVALGMDEQLNPTLYGKLALSIGPKLSGNLVVTMPVVDWNLLETELFKVSLPAFWEKEWEVPDPMLLAMQNGNFSCFAGTYIATPECNKGNGGGEKLNPLELKQDGTLVGGGSFYSEDFFPKTNPISVSKNEDGSYKCVWETITIYDPAFPDEEGTLYESYYTIYPVGVIEEKIGEKQAYLRDVVYIHCVYVDGGVLDGTYYSDSIANIVTDYAGDDWVSQEAYTGKIGEKLISGTGIEYEVVATENNFDAGGLRTRIVLETKDGKRWMIPNLPAFYYDERTGIIYFNIYEYVSNPDYVEDSVS